MYIYIFNYYLFDFDSIIIRSMNLKPVFLLVKSLFNFKNLLLKFGNTLDIY